MIFTLKDLSESHLEEGFGAVYKNKVYRNFDFGCLVDILLSVQKKAGDDEDENLAKYSIHQKTGEELYRLGKFDLVDIVKEDNEEAAAFKEWFKGAQFVKRLLWLKATGGRIFVSKAESDKRAKICLDCDRNGMVILDNSRLKADATIAKYLKIKYNLNSGLKYCKGCKCNLQHLVFLSREAIGKLSKNDLSVLSPQCWKRNLTKK